MTELTTGSGRLLLETYLRSLRGSYLRPETIRHRAVVLSLLDRTIGLHDLTPELLATLADIRGWAQSTRYGYVGVAALFSAWAFGEGARDTDPFARARRPRQPKYRPRPVLPDDLAILEAGCREPVRSFVILAAYAGLRRGEIAKVRHEHLQPTLLGYEIRVPDGKGGKDDVVPAHQKVVDLFDPCRRGLLFGPWGRTDYPYSTSHVGTMAAAAFRGLGVDATLHQLRHTFGTTLYRATHDVLLVQRAMRHDYLTSTQIYVAPDTEWIANAVMAL